MRNYRCPAPSRRSTSRCSALPAFRGVAQSADLRGRIHIGPGIDYLERAFDASKYGEISVEPYLDVTIPIAARSLAGAGRRARDVGLHAVRARTGWPMADVERGRRGDLLRTVLRHARSATRPASSRSSTTAGHHAARSRVDLRA